ncbi:hypothetical protein MBLNU13_g11638t1 [Cladosporium sp. NU13]
MATGGHTSGDAVAGVTISFTIVAAFCTIMRLYTRFVLNKMGGVDDVFIAIATVLAVALTTTMCAQVKYGMGRHQSSLTAHDLLWTNRWFWVSLWTYYSALYCAKLAILLQYLRIFPQETFRRVNYGLIAFITAYSCWTIFSAIFSCTPVSYFWTHSIDPNAKGTCLNRLVVWFTNAALNIVTDIAVAVLPLPVIKTLNLPKSQKLALTFVFCLGGITCVVSLMRLQSLYAVSVSEDISWDNPMAALWSNLEVNIGIICSCLPTLKTCVMRVFPKMFTSSRGTSTGHGIMTIGGGVSGGYGQGTGGRKKNRDSIGMNFLGRGKRDVDVYEGRTGEFDDMGTQIRPGSPQMMGKEGDGIQVVTVVQQDSAPLARDGSRKSDSESTRKLVREFP